MKNSILFLLANLISFIFCIALMPNFAMAEQVVTLSAAEQGPYIGENLPNNGYVGELVTAAFKRVGYKVNIEFYPLARAKEIAKMGKVDGLIPVFEAESDKAQFLFSNSFPGNNIVLFKKKSFIPSLKINEKNTLSKQLSQYQFGVVRGSSLTLEFEKADYLKKTLVSDDLKNIDNLMSNQVQLIVIDKYTASDLMVKERPHYIGSLDILTYLTKNLFHIAFSRKKPGAEKLTVDFNRGLAQLVADGTLNKIMQAHGLFNERAESANKKTIVIGTVKSEPMLIMQKLALEYEKKHKNIKFEWRILDENVLRLRLLSDLAISDSQFDIMTIGAYETPIWGKNQWLVPIKNIPANYDLNDVLAPIQDSLSYQKQLYALPFYGESSMTFYRKDLFEKAKLTMPAKPTYEDILKFAAAIHDPTHEVYGICLRGSPGWGDNMAYVGTLINTAGGRWFDENWKVTINTPEWHKALEVYKDLLTHYGPPNPSRNSYGENLNLFRNGHCGMWIDATVFAGMLMDTKNSKVADKIAFAPAPIMVTEKGSHWLWTWALAVPASSKMQNEALQFVYWATSKEYTNLVAKKQGWVNAPSGTRISTYKNKNYRAEAPFADIVLNSILEANPNDSTLKPVPYSGIQFVAIPEFVSIGTKVGEYVADMIEGKITIDQALNLSQEAAEAQMTRKKH